MVYVWLKGSELGFSIDILFIARNVCCKPVLYVATVCVPISQYRYINLTEIILHGLILFCL